MTKTAISKNEADIAMEFICETKEGRYTAKKPDIVSIRYARLVIQEGDTTNIYDECYQDAILYGISY